MISPSKRVCGSGDVDVPHYGGSLLRRPFLAYALYRWSYPEAFLAGSKMMDIRLGAINTMVLLTSSLTMAMAVHSAHEGKRNAIVGYIF